MWAFDWGRAWGRTQAPSLAQPGTLLFRARRWTPPRSHRRCAHRLKNALSSAPIDLAAPEAAVRGAAEAVLAGATTPHAPIIEGLPLDPATVATLTTLGVRL